MTDKVFVKGLVVHAHHGVGDEEARAGQNFILDLDLELDLSAAARSDRLADTASYDDIVATARGAFVRARYRLVEAAAGEVAAALLAELPQVNRVTVTVLKPSAPIDAQFEHVGVTLTRTRHG